MDIKEIVNNQRNFYNTHKTKDLNYRENTLLKIRKWIQNNESIICEALKKDLNKNETEAYMCEIGMTLSELNDQIKHFRKWSKPHKVKTPLAQFYGTSFELAEPYGVVLVMSPWNYPFMLTMAPAIGAIAAGNCVVIKPSAYAPNVSHIIKKLVDETCDARHICVVEGGRNENTQLLEQRFDYIFFTGSVNVGKLVMEKASKNLTPVTLELGGKSPCLVDKNVDLKVAVKRIAFGKYLNAGQTCVAVDYLLIHESLVDSFIKELRVVVNEFFKNDPLNHEQLVKIINKKHFDRLNGLLENQKIIPNVIVVDPPRRGLDNTTIKNILKIKPKKVVYISCNPASLVRDLAKLEKEYEIKSIRPFDMFPFSKHVETVSVLEIK